MNFLRHDVRFTLTFQDNYISGIPMVVKNLLQI